jgi:SpoVK/Ycf46/Vps4 family AAA+-type ATPase
MPRKIEKLVKLRGKADAEWQKNYRVWDANRKIFLYPENWIEPELRLSAPLRVSLMELALFIRPRCNTKGVRILLAGKNRARCLVAAQTLARCLGKKLYRIDLRAVVSKYIGETEKNLGRVFDAARRSRAALFFDEVDALFGKRSEVKDSHDRYANVEINYLLRRCEKYGGLTILGANNRTRIHKTSMRRFHFNIPIPWRRKPRRQESSTC